jgi:hypothetical protein
MPEEQLGVLARMIGFIDAYFVRSLVIAINTAPSLIYSLCTEAITSNHYEIFLSFILQSSWTAHSPVLDTILQFQSPWFLTLYPLY